MGSTKVDDIDERIEIVHGLVQADDLENATAILIALAHDFAPDKGLNREARDQGRQYTELLTLYRRNELTTEEYSVRRSRLAYRVQELAEAIKKDAAGAGIAKVSRPSMDAVESSGRTEIPQGIAALEGAGGRAESARVQVDNPQAAYLPKTLARASWFKAREEFAARRAKAKALLAHGTQTLPEGGEQPPPEDVMFWCRGLEKEYRLASFRFHLGPISFELAPGEITGLVGANGSVEVHPSQARRRRDGRQPGATRLFAALAWAKRLGPDPQADRLHAAATFPLGRTSVRRAHAERRPARRRRQRDHRGGRVCSGAIGAEQVPRTITGTSSRAASRCDLNWLGAWSGILDC